MYAGYPSPDVATEIGLKLPSIILSEIDETSREISARYLKYSILNANKLLGKIGHFSAASIAICHIFQVLNILSNSVIILIVINWNVS